MQAKPNGDDKLLRKVVKGMLPKNKLGAQLLEVKLVVGGLCPGIGLHGYAYFGLIKLLNIIHYICIIKSYQTVKLNRIKAVLLEKGISQTWLAKQLDKSFSMVNAYACNRYLSALISIIFGL